MDKISTIAKKYWKYTAIGATLAFATAAVVYATKNSSDDVEDDTTIETD